MILPETVDVADMVRARDERAARQREMLAEHGNALVSFTLNIAGEVKRTSLSDYVFDGAVREIREALGEPAACVITREKTGSEALFSYDLDPYYIKTKCVALEESLPGGRLLDLDVIGTDGIKIARRETRRCLVCGRPAAECARSRAHGLPAVKAATLVLLKEAACRIIASSAEQSLLEEARLTPKPGLVDKNNNGANEDMDLAMLESSAAAISPYFADCAKVGMEWAKPGVSAGADCGIAGNDSDGERYADVACGPAGNDSDNACCADADCGSSGNDSSSALRADSGCGAAGNDSSSALRADAGCGAAGNGSDNARCADADCGSSGNDSDNACCADADCGSSGNDSSSALRADAGCSAAGNDSDNACCAYCESVGNDSVDARCADVDRSSSGNDSSSALRADVGRTPSGNDSGVALRADADCGSSGNDSSSALRADSGCGPAAELVRIGKEAESAMYRATGGVNTHKGAIYAIGIMCAALGHVLVYGGNIFEISSEIARSLAEYSSSNQPHAERQSKQVEVRRCAGGGSEAETHGQQMARRYGAGGGCEAETHGQQMARRYGAGGGSEAETHGQQMARRYGAGGGCEAETHGQQMARQYGAGGARAESINGFVTAKAGLEALRASGGDPTPALLAIMSVAADTNVLYRAGKDGLTFVQAGASHIARLSGEPRTAALLDFDRELIKRNINPGGSADMLAAALFLYKNETYLS